MGLSASQGRLLLLTAKQSDLEFRAQQISQKRLVLAQQLEEISKDYEDATSNRVMDITMYTNDVDETGNKVRRTGNLTYKNLISGTLDGYAAAAGIQPYEKTKELGAVSTVPYRLTDASGAIVVSSYDEILNHYEIVDTITDPPIEQEAAYDAKTGIYTVTKESIYKENGVQKGETEKSESKYFIIPQYKNDGKTETELYKNCKAGKEYSIDTSQGVIKIEGDKDGEETYYNLSTGEKIEKSALKDGKFTGSEKATAAKSKDSIPMSSTTVTNKTIKTYSEAQENLSIKQGGDGVYTVFIDGQPKQRYVVDPGLAGGSSSDIADPNYLQDCLRNGKYIIEKYNKPQEGQKEGTWTDISWDATSNISDRYYTEDDAAAKAKYDRKQNEIQNADKKLELELDNVESQRNAVKTEIESVEKVINDNIDKSFKTFA